MTSTPVTVCMLSVCLLQAVVPARFVSCRLRFSLPGSDRFGHCLTLCTLNMHLLTYLPTYLSNSTSTGRTSNA